MKKILMIVAVGLMSLPMFAQTADNSDVLRRADVMPVFQDCEDERYCRASLQLHYYAIDGVFR